MLKDRRTWTTLAYLILMLPIGIVYFVIAVVGLSLSLALPIRTNDRFRGTLRLVWHSQRRAYEPGLAWTRRGRRRC